MPHTCRSQSPSGSAQLGGLPTFANLVAKPSWSPGILMSSSRWALSMRGRWRMRRRRAPSLSSGERAFGRSFRFRALRYPAFANAVMLPKDCEPRGEPLEAINRSAGEHDRRRGDPVTRLSLAFLVLVLAIYGARAAEKSYRLGDLEPTAASAKITRNTIVPELAKLGFQEGTNLVIDERVGDATAMPGLAQDLILSRPDAIIAFGTDAILAAHKASATIPIVTFGPDPVTLGLAASVARPGGHVTGVADLPFELDAKRLDLLRQAVPMAKRVAALVSRSAHDASERAMREVAVSTGAKLFVFEAAGPDDYPAASPQCAPSGRRLWRSLPPPISTAMPRF